MKQLCLGMPTLIELDTIEENMDLCKKLELDFIELNMNLPQYQPSSIDSKILKRLKESKGIFYTIHLPEEFDCANFNKDVRNSYKKIFMETVKIAKDLSVPIINMHLNQGVYFKLPDKKIYLYEKYCDDYLRRIREFATYSGQLLKGSSIKLAIENTGIYDKQFIQLALHELIQEEHIVLTWDIGHDYSSGYKDTKLIMNYEEKVKHMHLHNAIGEENHLPLNTGEIDFTQMIALAKKNTCRCVIEAKTIQGLIDSKSVFKA
jgi:sugar phosphate isomerase/epimerase